MQPVELFPAAPAANSPARSVPASTTGSAGTELFHSVMGRALARSTSETEDTSDPAESLPSRDRRTVRSKQPDVTDAGQSNPAACTDAPVPVTPLPSGNSSAGAAGNSSSPPPDTEAPNALQGQPAVPTTPTPDAEAKSSLNLALLTGADQASADGKSGTPIAPNASAPVKADPAIKDSSAPLPADEASAGISGAECAVAMKKAAKANDFSGSTEQNLPGDAALAAQPAVKAARAIYRAAHLDKSGAFAASPTSDSALPADNASAATMAVQWAAPARSLERIHDLVLLHAYRLRDSGEDALQVVLRPGSGLQLSLHLQMRDGVVEMQALLQRGNYELLNLHWPELQQQLEARGVRVAALEQGDPAATGDRDLSRQSNGGQPREQSATDAAFGGFAHDRTHVPEPSIKVRPATPRGWESWA